MTTAAKRKSRLGRPQGSDRVFVTVNYFLLALFFLITLYPLLYVLSASFSDPAAVSTGKMVLFPVSPSTQGYDFVFAYKDLWRAYGNTVFYTVLGTLVNLAVTIPCAYALSLRYCPFRRTVMVLFMITMYFSGGLIPSYLNISSMGLVNTRVNMLIMGAVSTYNLIVARTFFANTIPWELHEAAFLDGCSDFKTLLKIVLPLSSPIIVVLTMYYGVGHWNSYFSALIYLQDRDKFPLQIILREILTLGTMVSEMAAEGALSAEEIQNLMRQAERADMIKYCIIVVATVPMMIVYPFLQKYFAKGVMIGSVKG